MSKSEKGALATKLSYENLNFNASLCLWQVLMKTVLFTQFKNLQFAEDFTEGPKVKFKIQYSIRAIEKLKCRSMNDLKMTSCYTCESVCSANTLQFNT
jgi:hypothetical protein